MSLQIGDKLGPYEVLAPIGKGGMGEVWKARDTRLGRDVAIKISAEQFSERFETEARAIAALNHPHICQIYDVGPDYLVMEYIDGTPLKGPLAMEKAIEYSGQILDALDAAHRKGITHRDLKPANVLVTKQGIKLLDFGLAKVGGPLKETDATLTQTLTGDGQIVGTLQYMSPEQLEGKEADARSDIFAFGLVLYELITAKQAFDGKSRASLIASILKEQPPRLRELQPLAPIGLERVVQMCIEKDPDKRWQSASDLQRTLTLPMIAAATTASVRKPWQERAGWVAAATCFLIAGSAVLMIRRQPALQEQPIQFQIGPPPGVTFRLGVAGGSAISPDGRMIAVAGTSNQGSKLWLRSLDAVNLRELPFTDGAQFPFWSPDSRSIAFFAEGKLKRVDLLGGSAFVIADAPNGRGGTWNSDGIIVFAATVAGRLRRVYAAGGTPIGAAESELAIAGVAHRWPEFLPDGRQFLFFGTGDGSYESNGAYLSSLDRPREKATRLVTTYTNVAYSPLLGQHTGYLLWLRGSTLVAQPFDPLRARLTGDAVPVPGLEPLAAATLYRSFSVARNGTILVERGDSPYQLTWFDRVGRPQSTVGRVDKYSDVHLAPKGNRAAVSLVDSSGYRDIWVLDFVRAAYTRLSSGGSGFVGVWSPDGKRIAYHKANLPFLYARSANGVGQEEKLLESRFAVYINDWSSDGRYVVYTESAPETQYDLWLLPTFGDHKPVQFLKTPASESQGQISPDGRWIAYTSDDSGREEVYVRSFPSGAVKWPASNSGGSYPRWRRDGKELFYRALDGRLMATTVRAAGQELEFGSPTALFRLVEPLGAFAYPYDVSPDGNRIMALARNGNNSDFGQLTVLTNWQAGLKK